MNNSWIKRLEETIDEAGLIPLWGAPPAFPWEEFAVGLAETLKAPDLRVKLEKSGWKNPHEYLSGLGETPHIFTIELPPLKEPAFFGISSEDAQKLTMRCLTEGRAVKSFSHHDFQEGFLQFLLLQVLDLMSALNCFHDLSPKCGRKRDLPTDEGGFCHDLALTIGKDTMRGRIFCSSSFHYAFRDHFSAHKPSLAESPIADETILSLRQILGSTTLARSAWETIQIGDLLVLERCTYDPDLQKGSVEIALEQTPLFRGRIKEKSLKIVDYAFTSEETMTPSDEDEMENSEEIFGEETQESPIETMLSTEEIPLKITVEIGRLKMSAQKVLQLQPGNVVELGISPEQGVHLTIEGKRIARGELVKVGELLGVRILEMKR